LQACIPRKACRCHQTPWPSYIWRAFKNRYWPADYFIDAQGRIRDHSFGQGDYVASEHVIQQLLAKAGNTNVSGGLVAVNASGAEAVSDTDDVRSPETYIGYARAEKFVSPGGAVKDGSHIYAAGKLQLNEWGLSGDWMIGEERARLNRKDGSIVYRFHARDLHLVLGSARKGNPIRFRVTIDGAPPGDSHGADVDADGQGVVTGQRLYQLVRQNGAIDEFVVFSNGRQVDLLMTDVRPMSAGQIRRKSGSHWTRRWRKPDSNSQSHLNEKPFRAR
jgi:hypothetical protein